MTIQASISNIPFSHNYYSPAHVQLAIESFFLRNRFNHNVKNLNDVENVFLKLATSINLGDFDATLIGNHIYETITNKQARTRRVTAINFEELLVDFFHGSIIDKNIRKTITVPNSPFSDADIDKRVKRNRLEKGDVQLDTKFIISAKTLVPTNKELNIGSFSSEALFKGFITPIPQERQHLGSKPLLKKIFEEISKSGNWSNFVDRFVKMVNYIFVYDWIIGIKNDKIIDIYTISSQDFKDILISHMNGGPQKAIEFINRIEAHALRTELTQIFNRSKHTQINLYGKSTSNLLDIYDQINSLQNFIIENLCENKSYDQIEQEFEKHLDNIRKAIKD